MQLWVLTAGVALAGFAATLLPGCSAGNDVMAPLAMPSTQHGGAAAPGQPTVNDRQRGFLDALHAAGVTPSDDLHALSIGSYVCQARAAGQNDQAVWDFVVPLVRSEVRTAHPNDDNLPAAEVRSVTANYIRVASEKLC